MDVLKTQEIASIFLCDLRLSEAEIKMLERCIDYVQNNCDDEKEIHWLTYCESHEELGYFYEDILLAIRNYIDPDYLPDKQIQYLLDEIAEDEEDDD